MLGVCHRCNSNVAVPRRQLVKHRCLLGQFAWSNHVVFGFVPFTEEVPYANCIVTRAGRHEVVTM